MKLIKSFCLLLLSILLLGFIKIELPMQSELFYVYDANETKYFNEEQISTVVGINDKYQENDYKPQIVVAFLDDTQNYKIDDYGTKLFNHWGIGDANYNNGILITFAYNNGSLNARIDVGIGLESTISDERAVAILNQNYTLIKSSNRALRAEGILNVFLLVSKDINSKYNIDMSNVTYPTLDESYKNDYEYDNIESVKEDAVSPFFYLFAFFSLLSGAIFGGNGGYRSGRTSSYHPSRSSRSSGRSGGGGRSRGGGDSI